MTYTSVITPMNKFRRINTMIMMYATIIATTTGLLFVPSASNMRKSPIIAVNSMNKLQQNKTRESLLLVLQT